ncbi:YkgJ family cysteine cluster protein [Candidatus Bathyarchaeota archaeon A05DMB-2]|jgi:Fe-S-cluster containining protein|nr:YkgJ family cysteine cluster protein [Candidatus Bathyarchaeota archaeon A05DMB-2]
MWCLRCGDCCTETEMLLSRGDIERLERNGYPREFFVLFDREGYAKLRNQHGHCVFFNVEARRCKVYESRPLGCRLYPVIYDEEKGIVVDEVCRAQNKFSEKLLERKGKKVLRLLKRIDAEAEGRRNMQQF